jgi:hypothetical protein
MTRPEILDTAKKCVCGKRQQDYGSPEDNFTTIADFWSNYTWAAHKDIFGNTQRLNFTPKDVAIMMALLKVARIATGSSEDSFVDLAGYAACAGEIVTLQSKSGLFRASVDDNISEKGANMV